MLSVGIVFVTLSLTDTLTLECLSPLPILIQESFFFLFVLFLLLSPPPLLLLLLFPPSPASSSFSFFFSFFFFFFCLIFSLSFTACVFFCLFLYTRYFFLSDLMFGWAREINCRLFLFPLGSTARPFSAGKDGASSCLLAHGFDVRLMQARWGHRTAVLCRRGKLRSVVKILSGACPLSNSLPASTCLRGFLPVYTACLLHLSLNLSTNITVSVSFALM